MRCYLPGKSVRKKNANASRKNGPQGGEMAWMSYGAATESFRGKVGIWYMVGLIDRVAKWLRRGIMGQNSSGVAMPKLISVTQAAKNSGLSVAYIRRLVATGKVKGEKIGAYWVIKQNDLQRFLATPRKTGRPSLDKQ